MKLFNPEAHRRYSVRLRGYDYRQSGIYVVTLCTKNRECLFGEIRGGKMYPNDYGRIMETYWQEIPLHHPIAILDSFVLMPNHIHGIVEIKPNAHCRGLPWQAPTTRTFGKPLAKSLSTIINQFKASVTRHIRSLDGYYGHIWQRNYHEHIIRTPAELSTYRSYILENPKHWLRDNEYPELWK